MTDAQHLRDLVTRLSLDALHVYRDALRLDLVEGWGAPDRPIDYLVWCHQRLFAIDAELRQRAARRPNGR